MRKLAFYTTSNIAFTQSLLTEIGWQSKTTFVHATNADYLTRTGFETAHYATSDENRTHIPTNQRSVQGHVEFLNGPIPR
uniref:Integrase catalytic domain-containing protein n=1 Tax=Mesocestoides corti TaxID=53468 RepID=A0A5K3G8B0_MESCO